MEGTLLLSCRLVLANRFICQLLPSIFYIFLQSWGRKVYVVWPESTVIVISPLKYPNGRANWETYDYKYGCKGCCFAQRSSAFFKEFSLGGAKQEKKAERKI
jgi:hypothetical protein